jgi:hypothetical protein
MSAQDFVEVYEDALDPRVCAELVAAYSASDKVARGETGSGVNVQLKDSWDLCISRLPEWKQGENILNSAVMRGLILYVRKYTYLALAPVALSRTDPKGGTLETVGIDDLRAMDDTQLQNLLVQLFRPGSINIQRYLADVGGYPYWHSEIAPKVDTDENLHRVLLWTIYLNDGFGDGETEFLYQGRKIVPKAGSLLIAPAGFTHTHRGNRPSGADKFIATSWILFQRAEQLYADPRRKGDGGH